MSNVQISDPTWTHTSPTSAASRGEPVSVLFVDDDPHILDGFRRQLRKTCQVHTATGAREALDLIVNESFAVVVSDYQMPGMNGIQFLSQVRVNAPLTVRIMLTGQADFSTAIEAVNQGNIFRFLIKPCMPVVLENVIEAGIEQHRLLIAERQLTQETLLKSVKVLVEILEIVQPEAFSRAARVSRYVKAIAARLGMAGAWQLEAAAMLSQIGWITLPPNVLAKSSSMESMTHEERQVFLTHASAGARMLEKIPRLEPVSHIIERQHAPGPDLPQLDRSNIEQAGASILKAAARFDALRHGGATAKQALQHMRTPPLAYSPEVLDALAAVEKAEAADEIALVPLMKLRAGMILEEDLMNSAGILVLGKGQEITPTFARRLQNCAYGITEDQLFNVRMPSLCPAT